jgi:hypothetical protein
MDLINSVRWFRRGDHRLSALGTLGHVDDMPKLLAKAAWVSLGNRPPFFGTSLVAVARRPDAGAIQR